MATVGRGMSHDMDVEYILLLLGWCVGRPTTILEGLLWLAWLRRLKAMFSSIQCCKEGDRSVSPFLAASCWKIRKSASSRRPDGSVGMVLVLPALTDCRWWFESLLVHSGVSSATRRKATGANQKKNERVPAAAPCCGIKGKLDVHSVILVRSRSIGPATGTLSWLLWLICKWGGMFGLVSSWPPTCKVRWKGAIGVRGVWSHCWSEGSEVCCWSSFCPLWRWGYLESNPARSFAWARVVVVGLTVRRHWPGLLL